MLPNESIPELYYLIALAGYNFLLGRGPSGIIFLRDSKLLIPFL